MAIVLAYLLVSIGVIVAFVGAVFTVGGSSVGSASAAADGAQKSELPRSRAPASGAHYGCARDA